MLHWRLRAGVDPETLGGAFWLAVGNGRFAAADMLLAHGASPPFGPHEVAMLRVAVDGCDVRPVGYLCVRGVLTAARRAKLAPDHDSADVRTRDPLWAYTSSRRRVDAARCVRCSDQICERPCVRHVAAAANPCLP